MKWKVHDFLEITEIDGQWIVLDGRENRFYGFNPAGGQFLKQIKETGDFNRAVQMLSEQFQVSDEQIRQDMSEFLKRLQQQGWVIQE